MSVLFASTARPRHKLRQALVAIFLSLQGCVDSTQLVQNEKVLDDDKARGQRSSKEVLLIPPKEDPRNVVPHTLSQLEAMGFQVVVGDPAKPSNHRRAPDL